MRVTAVTFLLLSTLAASLRIERRDAISLYDAKSSVVELTDETLPPTIYRDQNFAVIGDAVVVIDDAVDVIGDVVVFGVVDVIGDVVVVGNRADRAYLNYVVQSN